MANCHLYYENVFGSQEKNTYYVYGLSHLSDFM